MRRRFHTRLLLLVGLLLPTYASADDAIALSGSTRDVVTSAAASEPSSGDIDDSPSGEDAPEPESEPPRRRGGGRDRNGPRRVPELRGASYERAQRLGLGTRDAAVILLHQTPRTAWVTAAGRARVRDLRWPVDEGGFGRGVGYVRTDRPEVPHNGVDIVAPRGSIIHAAADGIVAYSDNGLRGYGNCVIIVHANGWITLYGHADRTTVQPGWRVRRGERIGFVGSTGHSQGPHLHFELRVDGRPVDPMTHFPGQPWVTGRARLNELRARADGGHSREHLGEIEPDFEPAADPAPARIDTPAERAEARRVAARMRRTHSDDDDAEEASERADRATPPRVARTRDAERATPPRVTRTRDEEPATPPRVTRTRDDEPATPPRVARTRDTEPQTPPRVTRTHEPERSERAEVASPRTTRATERPARPVEPAREAPVVLASSGFPTEPPANIASLLANGPSVGMLARVEGRTFETLLFPLRDGDIVGGRTRLDLRADAGASMRASADGRVVYVGHGVVGDALSVVLVHRNGFVTVYSGFARVHVESGASVLRGAWLGTVRTSGALSFELRIRGRRTDPRSRFVLAPVAREQTASNEH